MQLERKSISFTERMLGMIDEIQDAKGYVSFSDVIHQSIVDMHSKTFPAYVQTKRDSSPAGIVKRKDEMKKIKEEQVKEEFLSISASLGGEIIVKGENEFCRYYTYTGKQRYLQEIPLNTLTSDLIKNQFYPNKEKVEKLQQEGKTEYEV